MKIDGFPYEEFEGFIQDFFEKLKDNKSFLLKEERGLDLKKLDDCITNIKKIKVETSKDNIDSNEKKKKKDEKKNRMKEAINKLDDDYKMILLHAYWLWYLPFIFNKREKLKGLFEDSLIDGIDDKYLKKENGFPGMGQVALHIHDDVVWILENVFQMIRNFSDYNKFKTQFIVNWKNKDVSVSSKNLLLHIMAPDQFEPIAITNEKKKIVKAFSSLLKSKVDEIDDALYEIRKELNIENDNFYDDTIRPFWDTPELSTKVDKDDNLPLDALLKFKKAIVLYGPPGTSKTFTARELAKNIISIDYVKKLKDNNKADLFKKFRENASLVFGEPNKGNVVKVCNENDTNEIIPHIHRLQLHPNYTYDDFIAGKTITVKDGETKIETRRGYLLNLISEIRLDNISNKKSVFKDLPHIVILDEINRVDISRVFGELFTAMEPGYREVGVELPLTNINDKPLKLIVPENLYFIGTMNLIDFSLEQVDFALRRRFAWVERNYDKDKLKIILDNKINDNTIGDIDEETVSNYIKKCSALNIKKISEQSNLGPAYQIGHTFFAEVIDIYKELRGDKQDKDKKIWDSAVEFLWNISIKPMIEAYCGTMDSEAQKNFIEECRKAFCPKPKDEDGQSQTTETTNE